MKPSRRLLALLGLLFLAALPLGVRSALSDEGWPALETLWWGLLGTLLLLAGLDAAGLHRRPSPRLERRLPGHLPQGRWGEVGLRLTHDYRRALSVELFDHLPDGLLGEPLVREHERHVVGKTTRHLDIRLTVAALRLRQDRENRLNALPETHGHAEHGPVAGGDEVGWAPQRAHRGHRRSTRTSAGEVQASQPGTPRGMPARGDRAVSRGRGSRAHRGAVRRAGSPTREPAVPGSVTHAAEGPTSGRRQARRSRPAPAPISVPVPRWPA